MVTRFGNSSSGHVDSIIIIMCLIYPSYRLSSTRPISLSIYLQDSLYLSVIKLYKAGEKRHQHNHFVIAGNETHQ